MLFQTPEFLLLMAIVLVAYYYLPGLRLYILVAADMVFYAAGGIAYLGLFLFISTLSYLMAWQLQGKRKKLFLWLAIALNVANLVFFKYTCFILTNLQNLTSIPLLSHYRFFQHLILPIGISFYTFELIAYVVDVYKEKIPPAHSWLTFWVFISFFPHRISGPIMRGKDLIPQISRLKTINISATLKIGLAYLAMGLVKKIIIADHLASSANNFFASAPYLSSMGAWAAAYLYTFQIYYDFSAYSEMAVGIGYLFGIKLDLNFKTPYLSANPTEFWRRWHITLSNWIRDYLYIPLGGSWYGTRRKYLNLFIAMAISGLWHGAAWTFVIWGMYHGILLIMHNIYKRWHKPLLWQKFSQTRFYHVAAILVTFHLICIGWVFFRVNGVNNAAQMVLKMLTFNPLHPDATVSGYFILIGFLYFLHVAEYWARKNYRQLAAQWQKYCPVPVRALAYTALIVILVLCTQTQPSSFIYFKF